MIAVVGSIQSRSWDGQDGKKQYATEVNVEEAYFTGSKSEGSQYNQTPQNYNQAPQQQGFGDDFDMDGFNDIGGDEPPLSRLNSALSGLV